MLHFYRVDEFIVECPSLGTIQKLRIGHDNTGPSPGWYLDKVIVDDLDNKRVYEFQCNRWMAKDEDDGLTYRDLVAGLGADEAPPGKYLFRTTFGKILLCTPFRVFSFP